MAYDYDLLVIGSGPAGEKGAAQAAYFGKRVAIVEKADEPGGAAVHTGTLPSKTLRETALFLSGYRQRELYSVSVSFDAALAIPRLLSRKDTVREMEVDRIHDNLDRHRIASLHGTARVLDPHTVEVSGPGGSRSLTAEFILVATGSVPFHPAGIDFPDTSIDDSDEILTIDSMPHRLIVLGAGVIGCEYACVFATMGAHVTLLDSRPQLLPFLDMEISQELHASMVRLGINVRLGEVASSVRREGDEIAVSLASGIDLHCDRLLNAAGRSGATAGLGLEEAGVRMAQRGCIEVDANYRTSVPSIYAAGDVIGFPALASTSMEQGRVAVCRAFAFDYKQHVSTLLPYGIFTIPEVSAVGLTEQEAAANGRPVVCGRALYRDNARGKIIGATEGMVKLVFDAPTRRLAGVHIIGDGAAELLHIGQAMITLGGTVETLVETVFNYPTLSDCYKYAAYDALGRWPPG